MSAPPDPASATTLRYFGDYLLLGEIAAGGMGVVYNAQQVSLNRPVAVKLIRGGQLASDAEVRRFRTEAEAAARLDHPNIVPIYEIGTHDGQHFISMKLIEGESLAERMPCAEGRRPKAESPAKAEAGAPAARVPFAIRDAASVLSKLARAVAHAHQRGVLHRDIKPANILLDEAGEPYLAAFGLAKLLERDTGLTLSTAILGTPHYMAPEQASGKTRRSSPASDLYSLGAVFYALLTGRPPFAGETPTETLDWVQHREPARPRTLNPRVPPPLEAICLQCLEKEPACRYADASALADDLDRWLRGESVQASAVRPWTRLGHWARHHPAAASLATALVLSVLLGLTAGAWLWHRSATGQLGDQSSASHPSASRTVKWQSVTAPTIQAQPNCGYRIAGGLTATVTLPTVLATGDVVCVSGLGPADWRLIQNSNQVIRTDKLGGGAPGWAWVLCATARQWSRVAMSANGQTLIAAEFGFEAGAGRIHTSTNFGAAWRIHQYQEYWNGVASSADGATLVAAGWFSQIHVSTNGGARWNRVEKNRNWTSVACSADGLVMAATDHGTNGGWLYTSHDRGVTWIPRDTNRQWRAVACSADGSRMVASGGAANYDGTPYADYLYTSSDGGTNWLRRMADQPRRWGAVASSADGIRLAAMGGLGSIYLSADSGNTWTARLTDTTRAWMSLAMSADGRTLIAVGGIGVGLGPVQLSLDGGNTWTTRDPVGAWHGAACSSDGQWLAVASGDRTNGGPIYVSGPSTVPGAAGSFAGAPGAEIELEYLGDHQFQIRSASGTFTVEDKVVQAKVEAEAAPRR